MRKVPSIYIFKIIKVVNKYVFVIYINAVKITVTL